MDFGLWKLGWPGSQVAGIFSGILLLRGLGLAPGLYFFGLGCRWTSKIMDALVYEYILASGRESGHLEGICKESGFSEFFLLGSSNLQAGLDLGYTSMSSIWLDLVFTCMMWS